LEGCLDFIAKKLKLKLKFADFLPIRISEASIPEFGVKVIVSEVFPGKGCFQLLSLNEN